MGETQDQRSIHQRLEDYCQRNNLSGQQFADLHSLLNEARMETAAGLIAVASRNIKAKATFWQDQFKVIEHIPAVGVAQMELLTRYNLYNELLTELTTELATPIRDYEQKLIENERQRIRTAIEAIPFPGRTEPSYKGESFPMLMESYVLATLNPTEQSVAQINQEQLPRLREEPGEIQQKQREQMQRVERQARDLEERLAKLATNMPPSQRSNQE